MKKKAIILLIVFLISFTMVLTGCSPNTAIPEPNNSKEDTTTVSTEIKSTNTIVVGCLAREEPDVLFVADKMKELGYEVKAQIFSDVITTNMALEEGDIGANFIQNRNYLGEFNKSKDTHLVAPGVALTSSPVGLYSRKYKSLDELPDGFIIAISNDPVNRARELSLMQASGLIELDQSIPLPTISDVISNPRNIEIIEMESRSKWGAFDDVDVIPIQAISIYLMDEPENRSNKLAVEDLEVTQQVAGTLLVVHEDNSDVEWLKEMEEIMTSDDFAVHLANTYKGAKVPMFETNAYKVKD